jgi:hypothetical protein
MSRFRPRLTYANVMSSIAVFAVLGGGAYAGIDRKIRTADLQNRAVTAPKVANNAVTPRAIRNNAVRPRKIVNNAVRTRHIFDGAVSTEKIAQGAVTTDRIAQEAVTTDRIAPFAVEHARIADNAVIENKIADGAVTENKVSDAIATKGGNEPVREVGTAGNPAFGAGWTNFGGDFERVGFFKDQFGMVHLRGLANCNSGTTMFTLPQGYRPARTHYQNVATGAPSASGVNFLGRMSVLVNGNVQVFACGGGFTSLSNTQFRVDD